MFKKNSDKLLFDDLYKKYFGNVYNYFWYRLNFNEEESLDMAQETFLKAFKKFNEFKFKETPYLNYLLKIAHNKLIDHYRYQKNHFTEDLESIKNKKIKSDIENEEDLLDKKIILQKIEKELNKLPIEEKDILLMFYRKQLTIKEITIITGKTENTIKTKLSRSRQKIKKSLSSLYELKDFPYFEIKRKKQISH